MGPPNCVYTHCCMRAMIATPGIPVTFINQLPLGDIKLLSEKVLFGIALTVIILK